MTAKLILAATIVVFVGLIAVFASPTATPTPCPCTKNLNRTCGEDGKWYSNPCERGCQNVTAATNSTICGPEPDGGMIELVKREACLCQMIYSPVCSTANITFSNNCSRTCDGYTFAYNGTCSDSENTQHLP